MPNKDELDFEICFYETLIKDKPDFVEALIPLGDAYTRKAEYRKGLEIDQRLTKLKPRDPTVFYNLACSYSLLKMKDAAIKALKKAIELGYDDFDYLSTDKDLENIKTDKRFKQLLIKYIKTSYTSTSGE